MSENRFTDLLKKISHNKDKKLYDDLYFTLLASYTQEHRSYHTIRHIQECLGHFDKISNICPNPNAVEFAIWYHDYIYETRQHDNEALSSEKAHFDLLKLKVDPSFIKHVGRLIAATTHQTAPIEEDEKYMTDIDLAIFGSDLDRFILYEKQISKEFSNFSRELYKKRRIEVLKKFYERDPLYNTEFFRGTLEKNAKENLKLLIEQLLMPG